MERNEKYNLVSCVKKFCKHCGTNTLHEFGYIINDNKKHKKIWVCIRCGLVTTEAIR